ncbi:hypothetical protein OC25_17785 [Pedobacter kyungheensis]|uniref:Uncharacterized protein n=1 Tax=Pedobacter kyungheensis TaxID=1069985 RepID=A0A0C1FKE3_9SPHI|nr:hypothetical protein [Pedobacter kyungheensis]KIA92283.1 hypothetical protein OC25_17785 [Pedobacter kyungheensis]
MDSFIEIRTISTEEYQQIKKECENAILRFEAELKELSQQVNQDLDIEDLADLALINLKNLPEFYLNADSDVKRAITGSIYYEKWIFDGELHRPPTFPLDPAFRLSILPKKISKTKKLQISLELSMCSLSN